MKYSDLIFVISKFDLFCNENKLNFIVVGSIAYMNIFPNIYSDDDIDCGCDDLDCVIVYDDINKLKDLNYLKKDLFETSLNLLLKNEIDLFATKFILNDVKVSLDFISLDYLKKLSAHRACRESHFLKKMTDAQENLTNDYYSFKGDQFIYRKKMYTKNGFNVYLLPIMIFHNDQFYSGVLSNKFIHNPLFLRIENHDIFDFIHTLNINHAKYYELIKADDSKADYTKSIRRWSLFSIESQEYIKDVFKVKK